MKLLIVDDSELLQEKLKRAIVKLDKSIEIRPAYNCAEAREVFGAFKPDTAILDISLPDGNGINLLEEFRLHSPTLRIMMMTNYSDKTIRLSCLEKGANEFFDKMNLIALIVSIKNLKINLKINLK